MSNVNWRHAPVDATHTGSYCLNANGSVKIWYKYEQCEEGSPIWSFWYSGGILDTTGWQKLPKGSIPTHLPLIARPTYKAPPVVKWRQGIDLPPVGEVVSFAKTLTPDNSTLFKKGIDEGTK